MDYRNVYESNSKLAELFSDAEDFEAFASNPDNSSTLSELGVDLTEKKNSGAESGSSFTSTLSGLESTSGSEPPSFLRKFYNEQIAPRPGAPKFEDLQKMQSMGQLESYLWSPQFDSVLRTKYGINSLDALKGALSGPAQPASQPIAPRTLQEVIKTQPKVPMAPKTYAPEEVPVANAPVVPKPAEEKTNLFGSQTSQEAKDAFLSRNLNAQNPFLQDYTLSIQEVDASGQPYWKDVPLNGKDPVVLARVLFDPDLADGVQLTNPVTRTTLLGNDIKTRVLNKENYKDWLMNEGMSEAGAESEILKLKEKYIDWVAQDNKAAKLNRYESEFKGDKFGAGAKLREEYNSKGINLITEQYGYDVAEKVKELTTGARDPEALQAEIQRMVGAQNQLYDPASGRLFARKDAPETAIKYKQHLDEAFRMYGTTDKEKLNEVRDNLFEKVEAIEKEYGRYRSAYIDKMTGKITQAQLDAAKDVFDMLDRYKAQLTALNIRLMGNVDIRPEQSLTGEFVSGLGKGLVGGDFRSSFNTARDEYKSYVDAVSQSGIQLNKQAIEETEKTIAEEVAYGAGASLPIMAEIAATSNAFSALGGVAALRNSRLIRPITRGVLQATGSRAVASFTSDVFAHSVYGAAVYAPTEESAATGVGEATFSGLLWDKLGLDAATKAWTPLLKYLGKVATGGTGETLEEYTGQYVDALVSSGFNWGEAADRAFGATSDERLKQLLVIASTSVMFSGAFNSPTLFERATRAEEVKAALRDYAANTTDPKLRETIDGAIKTVEKAQSEARKVQAEPTETVGTPGVTPETMEAPTPEAQVQPPSSEVPGESPVTDGSQITNQNNAVQIQETGQVPVQPEAGISGEMAQGKPEAKPKVAAEEGKKRVFRAEQIAKSLGGIVVGSSTRKGSIPNDFDIYIENKIDLQSMIDTMKSLGYKYNGASPVVDTSGKTYAGENQTAFSFINDKGQKVDVFQEETKEDYRKRVTQPLKGKPEAKPQEVTQEEEVRFQVDAWQGGPNDFNKEIFVSYPDGTTEYLVGTPEEFPKVPENATVIKEFPNGRARVDKIGTGEGAQAFGWGLYFTDVESIGRHYAEKLSRREIRSMYENDEMPQKAYEALDALDFLGFDDEWQAASVFYENDKKTVMSDFDLSESEYDNIIAALTEGKRNLYKVTLHKGKTPDQYTWLEWDKDISEDNAAKIKKQFEKEGIPEQTVDEAATRIMENLGGGVNTETFAYRPYTNLTTGADFYRDLVLYFIKLKKGENPQRLVSEFLLRAGIDGIKYPAESISRGATSDTARGSNYVVFDENAVTIEEKIQFQIIGENAQLSQNVRDNLGVAREMETQGKTPKEIRIATGWEKGGDGKWRYEIVDDASPEALKKFERQIEYFDDQGTVADFLPADSELLKAYPELKDVKVVIGDGRRATTLGSFNPDTDTITLYPNNFEGFGGNPDTIKVVYGTFLHEVQHKVQQIEGFARGGRKRNVLSEIVNFASKEIEKEGAQEDGSVRLPVMVNGRYPSGRMGDLMRMKDQAELGLKGDRRARLTAEKAYKSLGGEVEARNVQRRMNMTEEERRNTLLSETEDVAPESQIFWQNSQLGDGTQPAPERVSELVPRLQENFKNLFGLEVEVITDTTVIDQVLSDSQLVSPNGQVLGFVKGDKVYIDPRYARVDTPIHEFGHIWNTVIKRMNPEFYQRGIDLIKTEGQEYVKLVRKQYPGLSEEALYEEALTWAISDKGAKIINRMETPFFIKWLKEMWQMIGNKLGLTMDPDALASLSLNRYTELVAGTMLQSQSGLTGGQMGGQVGGEIRLQNNERQAIIDEAKKNGTYMKAPNGNPSRLNESQWVSVRTKAFKDWFGDWENDPSNASKVVDENGEPLVVYHGTAGGGFTEFGKGTPARKRSGLREVAHYFTTNRETALLYASADKSEEFVDDVNREIEKLEDLQKKTKSSSEFYRIEEEINLLRSKLSPAVYEVFLNIRRPFEFDGQGLDTQGWGKAELDIGYKTARGKADVMDALTGENRAYKNTKYDGVLAKNMADMSTGTFGSNGLVKKRATPYVGDNFAVWDPTQIKSATSNVGTFDPENPDIRYQLTPSQDVSAITSEFDMRKLAGEPVENIWNDMLNRGFMPGPMITAFSFERSSTGQTFAEFMKEKSEFEFQRDSDQFQNNYLDHLDDIINEFMLLQQQSPSLPLDAYVQKLVTGNTSNNVKYGAHTVFVALSRQLDGEELKSIYGEAYTNWASTIINNSNIDAEIKKGVSQDARAYRVTYSLDEAAQNAENFGVLGFDAIFDHFFTEIIDKGLQEYYGEQIKSLREIFKNNPNGNYDPQEISRLLKVKSIASLAGRLLAYTRALSDTNNRGMAEEVIIKSLEKTLPEGTMLTNGQKDRIRDLVNRAVVLRTVHQNLVDSINAANSDPSKIIDDKATMNNLAIARADYLAALNKLEIYIGNFKNGNWTMYEKWAGMIGGSLMSMFRSVTIGLFGNLEYQGYRTIWGFLGGNDLTKFLMRKMGFQMVGPRRQFLGGIGKSKETKNLERLARAIGWQRSMVEVRQILVTGQSVAASDMSLVREINRSNRPLKEFAKSLNMMTKLNLSAKDWADTFDRIVIGENGQITGPFEPKIIDMLNTFFWHIPLIAALPDMTNRLVAGVSGDRQIENMVVMKYWLDFAQAKGLNVKDTFYLLNQHAISTDRDSPIAKLGANLVFMSDNLVSRGILWTKDLFHQKMRKNNHAMWKSLAKKQYGSFAGNAFLYHLTGIGYLSMTTMSPFTKVPTNILSKVLFYSQPEYSFFNVGWWGYKAAKANKVLKELKAQRVHNQQNTLLESRIEKQELEVYYNNERLQLAMGMFGMSFLIKMAAIAIVNATDDDEDIIYADKDGRIQRVPHGWIMGSPFKNALAKEKSIERMSGMAGRFENRKTGLAFNYANMGIFGAVLAAEKAAKELRESSEQKGGMNIFESFLVNRVFNGRGMMSTIGTSAENLSFLQTFVTGAESIKGFMDSNLEGFDPLLVQIIQNALAPLYNNSLASIARAEGEKAPPARELSEIFKNYDRGYMSKIYQKALLKLSPKTPFDFMRSRYYEQWFTNLGVPDKYYNRSVFDTPALALIQAMFDPFAVGYRSYEQGKAEEARRYAEVVNDAVRFAENKLGVTPSWDFITNGMIDKSIKLTNNREVYEFVSTPTEGTVHVPFDILLKYRKEMGLAIMNQLKLEDFELQVTDLYKKYQDELKATEIASRTNDRAQMNTAKILESYDGLVVENKALFDRVFDGMKENLKKDVINYYADQIKAGKLENSTEIVRALVSTGDADVIAALKLRDIDVDGLK